MCFFMTNWNLHIYFWDKSLFIIIVCVCVCVYTHTHTHTHTHIYIYIYLVEFRGATIKSKWYHGTFREITRRQGAVHRTLSDSSKQGQTESGDEWEQVRQHPLADRSLFPVLVSASFFPFVCYLYTDSYPKMAWMNSSPIYIFNFSKFTCNLFCDCNRKIKRKKIMMYY